MFAERDRDLELVQAKLRQSRQENSREDLRILTSSWRAIVQSHWLLDRAIYTLERGELRALENGNSPSTRNRP